MHVYLILVPNSRSEPSAFSSRNNTSKVIVSRSTVCTLFPPPLFVSVFSQMSLRSAITVWMRRRHWLSRSTVTCLGCLPKVIVLNTPVRHIMRVAKGKFLTVRMCKRCLNNWALSLYQWLCESIDLDRRLLGNLLSLSWLYKYLAMIMQEKIKVMKNIFRIRGIRFYSAKVTSIQKSPQITHRTHGDSSQSPYPYHTHTHANPHTHGSPVIRPITAVVD